MGPPAVGGWRKRLASPPLPNPLPPGERERATTRTWRPLIHSGADLAAHSLLPLSRNSSASKLLSLRMGPGRPKSGLLIIREGKAGDIAPSPRPSPTRGEGGVQASALAQPPAANTPGGSPRRRGIRPTVCVPETSIPCGRAAPLPSRERGWGGRPAQQKTRPGAGFGQQSRLSAYDCSAALFCLLMLRLMYHCWLIDSTLLTT